jgi:hypothetical protein
LRSSRHKLKILSELFPFCGFLLRAQFLELNSRIFF